VLAARVELVSILCFQMSPERLSHDDSRWFARRVANVAWFTRPHMDRTQRTLVVIGLSVDVLVLGFSSLSTMRDPLAWIDGRILFSIVEAWWDGTGTLYPTTLYAQREPGVPSYRYPPFWGLSMVPLVLVFKLHSAIAIWGAFSLAVFIAGVPRWPSWPSPVQSCSRSIRSSWRSISCFTGSSACLDGVPHGSSR
jgi:hypothetical protein